MQNPPARSLGTLLRQMRTSRQMALQGVAAKSGLARSTLNRWELDTHEPRLPELTAVLDALGASPAQREQFLRLMRAPRAAQHLRQEAQTRAGARGAAWLYSLGGNGALLRAMRRRAGLSQEQVAERMGVRRHTLSRWEAGEWTPPPERWDPLLSLLRAYPEERAALVEGHLSAEFSPSADASLDTLEAHLRQLTGSPFNAAEEPLKDLAYRTLEARLAPAAARCRAGRDLLIQTYSWHGQWLSNYERHSDAAWYAERVLEGVPKGALPDPFCLRAATVAARCAVYGGRRLTPERGVKLLRRWIPFARWPEFEAWIYGDMALYLGVEGQVEPALEWSDRSCQVAQRCENRGELRLRNFDRARLLVQAGRHREALALLPTDAAEHPRQRALEARVWAEALLALGETAAAQEWLAQAQALVAAHESLNLPDSPAAAGPLALSPPQKGPKSPSPGPS
jgi:transcriptional regulator with XRE-family HTH domain